MRTFAEYKSRYIRELNTELKYLHHPEATRRDSSLTDGLTIEKKLGSILDLLRGKVRNRDVFHAIATTIDHCFNFLFSARLSLERDEFARKRILS
jgi:hypothetical protein